MLDHREFFDRHAENWDSMKTPEEGEKLKGILRSLGISAGEKILDVGCGTGYLFPFLDEITNKKAEVTGIDISQKMIDTARRKFGHSAKFLVSGAESIPAESETYDRVICYSSFPHFPDKLKALKEFLRVLKTGGKLNIIHTSSRKKINSLHRSIGGAVGMDRIPSYGKMKKILLYAGFGGVKIKDGKDSYVALGAA